MFHNLKQKVFSGLSAIIASLCSYKLMIVSLGVLFFNCLPFFQVSGVLHFITKCSIEALVLLLGFSDSSLVLLHLILNYTKYTIKKKILQENNMNSLLVLYSWDESTFISDIWSVHECRKYVLRIVQNNAKLMFCKQVSARVAIDLFMFIIDSTDSCCNLAGIFLDRFLYLKKNPWRV